MCIENFIVADPAVGGPYYGIASYWCWIAPAYSREIYTSQYLFMFTSAGFSFVLYLFVFLRLRGNITVTVRYKMYFHRRPKVRLGRTSGGTYILTDDRRLESQVTTIARQMLCYPVAYTILALPIGVSLYSAASGVHVPFPVIASTAALFMLSGFVNTVLFCATHSVLPESWKKRFSIGTKSDSRPGGVTLSTWGNAAWRRTEPDTRQGTTGAGRSSFVIDINVEKDIEIKYDDRTNPSSLQFAPPTAPTCPLRAYSGRQRADAYSYHIRQLTIPPIQDEGNSVRLEVDGKDAESYLNKGVHQARKPKIVDAPILSHPPYASRRCEIGVSGPAVNLDPSASVDPISIAASSNTDTRQLQTASILTFGTTSDHAHPSRVSGDYGGNSRGTNWTDHNGRLPQAIRTGVYCPVDDSYSYSSSYASGSLLGVDSRDDREHQGI